MRTYRKLFESRTIRAHEILTKAITSNELISIDHIKEMQSDVYDKQAEYILPLMLQLIKKCEKYIEYKEIEHVVSMLEDWDFKVFGNDKLALIYNMWLNTLFDELLQNHLTDDERLFLKSLPNKFLEVMIEKWAEGKELNYILCKVYEDKEKPCIYIMAYTLLKTYKQIVTSIGKNKKNWRWDYINSQEYYNPVFEGKLVKYLFHLKTYTGVSI